MFFDGRVVTGERGEHMLGLGITWGCVDFFSFGSRSAGRWVKRNPHQMSSVGPISPVCYSWNSLSGRDSRKASLTRG